MCLSTRAALTLCDHPHMLNYSKSLRHHVCDLCDQPIKKPHDGYRCSDGCDFDVCMKCAKAHMGSRPGQSADVLACKNAGAPMLCWQARASLMVVVLTVIERIVADEDEVPIVELRAIVKSLLRAVRSLESTPDSQMLSFAFGALSHVVQALAERPTELQDVISDGVRSMLHVIATLPDHGVLQMQVMSPTVLMSTFFDSYFQ
jgi:hypothetical protein